MQPLHTVQVPVTADLYRLDRFRDLLDFFQCGAFLVGLVFETLTARTAFRMGDPVMLPQPVVYCK